MSKNIKHIGVLGMHWGIRKGGSSGGSPKPPKASEDSSTTKQLKKKKVHQLSNSELKTVVTRLQLEKQYKDLTQNETGQGAKFIKGILSGPIGKTLVSIILKKVIASKFRDPVSEAYNSASDIIEGQLISG